MTRTWITAVVVCLAAVADAKTISITISQKTELQGERLVVKTTVGNTGDESAKAVAVNLRFGDDAKARGKLHDDLPPNGSFDEELSVPVGKLGEGRWPYRIAVDYADANLYPFQALLVTTVVVGSPPPAKLAVPEIAAPGGIEESESATLTVRMKNLSPTDRDTSYRVIAPEGIEIESPTGTVHLKGWGENTTSIGVVSRTALAGSRYPIFVAAEYEDEGMHQGIVAQGIVEIIPRRNFWQDNGKTLVGVAIVLVALWLALVVRRWTSRPA